jgi:phosphate-selective porin OprO/OprP
METENAMRMPIRAMVRMWAFLFLFSASAASHPLEVPPQQNPWAEMEALQRRIQEQEQVIEQLKRELAEHKRLLEQLREDVRGMVRRPREGPEESPRAVGEAAASRARTPSANSLFLWANGRPTFRSPDGDFEMAVSGEGQFDFRAYTGESFAPPNTFLLRRFRLAVSGKLLSRYEYKIQADFAERGSGLLRDGWLRIPLSQGVRLQVGNFKEPFSQEELRSAVYIDFVERAMAVQIAPSRSPGMQLTGEIARGRVVYQIGLFNGKGNLALNTTRTPEGVLRVRISPWRGGGAPWSEGLSFGGAFALGRQRGGMSLRGQTESQSAIFFSPRPVNGQVVRANGEVTYLIGPFALRAEYNQMAQDRYQLGPNRTTLPAVVAKGYAAQLTYVLTGEKKPENGPVVPRRSLLAAGAGDRGWGAWEVKARYSTLQLSDGAETVRAETVTWGVNWYLTPFVKYVLDLVLERVPATSSLPHVGHSFSLLTRLQFAF